MPKDSPLPSPRRPRRSQAERTAETRRRVMDAVIESIAEIGYRRTTGNEIARRAGVSWGAVQHHFGDKNGVLAAAVDETFQHLVRVLGAPEDPAAPLAERVEQFVSRAWRHFSSSHYRTAFDIFADLPAELEDLDAEVTARQIETWTDTWRRYFPDSRLTRRQTTDLMHYCVAVLSGLATTEVLGHRDARGTKRALSLLEETLAREIASE